MAEKLNNLDNLKALGRLGEDMPELQAGWDVFDIGGALEIERCDESTAEGGSAFDSDEEALGYVLLRALAGNARCIAALKECYGLEMPN